MNFELPPVGQPNQVSAPARMPGSPAPVAGSEPLGAAVEVSVSIPSSPPPELREEMARASQRVDELHEEGRELHFERDEESGKITVEVRDLEGRVLHAIPASRMLEVVAGASLNI